MKVVFLHGIGDGDPHFAWLRELNQGLTQAGHGPIDREQVIAPRYSSCLRTEGRSAKLPPVTYKPKDEPTARREFERRHARVQRLRVAAEHTRKLLDLPYDTKLRYQLTDFEGHFSALVNRIEPYSDPKSLRLGQLGAAKEAINAVLRFMIEKGLSPATLADGKRQSIDTGADR
ncbi:hypothetical protein [Mycobacterium sp. 48b]|uniref:hypothetical protein n=1 Tax=Mycobacterium sp. 48b TaxID=3400426 RepID=UPI003AAC6200